MSSIKKRYRTNIHGVIGTLIFHIGLVAVMLFPRLEFKGETLEEVIILDFTEEIKEIPLPKEPIKKEKSVKATSQITNRAVNRAPTTREVTKELPLDEEYSKELAQAKALMNRVNSTLGSQSSSEKSETQPEPTTKQESPKETTKKGGSKTEYRGDSNVTYYLEGRDLIYIKAPTYLSKKSNTVTVAITVNSSGVVTKATVGKSSTEDKTILEYAKAAALSAEFSKSDIPKQSGTITFRFIEQVN